MLSRIKYGAQPQSSYHPRARRAAASPRRLQNNGAYPPQSSQSTPRLPRSGQPPPPPPPSGAAAFQGVIGESKEGLGGNRNPPGPPWPPEAATRLLTQPKAAQERATKAARQSKNAEQRKTPCPCGSAPRQNAPLRRPPKRKTPAAQAPCPHGGRILPPGSAARQAQRGYPPRAQRDIQRALRRAGGLRHTRGSVYGS